MNPAAPCPALLPTPWLALGWALVLALPVLAWLAATALVGPGKSARAGRAALAVGRATIALIVLVAALRIFTSLVSATSPGPFAWLDLAGITVAPAAIVAGTAPTPSATSACRGAPSDVLLALAALDGVLLVAFAAFFASRHRGAPARGFRVPVADASAALLVVAALAFLLGTHEPYEALARDAALLDFAALVPILCSALAVWTRAADVRREDAAPEPGRAPATPDAVIDVPGLWRAIGALTPQAKPLFATAVRAVAARPAPDSADTAIWQHVGAEGDPPGALDVIGSYLLTPFQGSLVGDLPDPTERTLLAALLVRAIQRESIPCLIITEEAKTDAKGTMRSALRDTLDAAIRASGAWGCGPIVVGEHELRRSIAGRQMPAAAFLNVSELSSLGLRAFSRTFPEGARWASSVGLVVVARADRGTALAVTHRVFTMRRLGLALRAAGARWSVVATGLGGEGTRALVERMFPGIEIHNRRLDPRATAPVRAWIASDSFRHKPGPPWARRAVEPLVSAGLSVSVADPLGTLDLNAIQIDAAKVQLARDVTLDGDASLAELNDAWLLASFRALGQRIPLRGGVIHHALWSLEPSPVLNFLLREDTLKRFADQERIPSPSPPAGFTNRLLARAHLQAALREGEQDLVSLARMFDKALIDEVIPAGYVPERHAVRDVPGGGGLVRVGLAPPLPGEGDPLRDTVTENGARVIDRNGGRVLATIDWLTVRTRYYPGRVFSVGHKRYQVPIESIDPARREIAVEGVDAALPLTRPRLRIDLEDPKLVDPPLDVKRVAISSAVRLATFEVDAVETVDGVVHTDGMLTTYPAVTARYRTRIRTFSFAGAVSKRTLFHAARSLQGVLAAHLMVGSDDVEVVVLPDAFHPDVGAGLAVVDRHIQGIGIAEALDATAALEALVWVKAVLAICTCGDGCAECSPPEVLGKADKRGVLRLLGV